MGTSSINLNGPFSMAMLNNQRVLEFISCRCNPQFRISSHVPFEAQTSVDFATLPLTWCSQSGTHNEGLYNNEQSHPPNWTPRKGCQICVNRLYKMTVSECF